MLLLSNGLSSAAMTDQREMNLCYLNVAALLLGMERRVVLRLPDQVSRARLRLLAVAQAVPGLLQLLRL